MKWLNKIWPWNQLTTLHYKLDEERRQHGYTGEALAAALAYADSIEPEVKHIRFGPHIMLVGVNSTRIFMHASTLVIDPRMGFEVKGFDA